MTRRRKLVLAAFATLALFYVALVGLLYVYQRSFFYPRRPNGLAVAALPPGFEDLRLRGTDGLTLRAFYRPARAGLPTILFFHGNGSGLASSVDATRLLTAQGYGAMLPEYRGYGGNPGSPTEQGLYRDGEAAVRWLAAQGVPAGRIVAIGNSLGTGVATEMAARHRLAGLVLLSGFSSMVHVAGERFPIVPTGLLVKDRYENAAKLPSVGCPVLLQHGTADRVVPVDNSRLLAAALPSATLQIFPGAGHDLIYHPESRDRVLAWLRATIGNTPSPL